MNKKVAFLISHPIQYLAPLFRKLSSANGIELTVLYCESYGIEERHHSEVGTIPAWDIPLLEGYKYKFLKNYSPSPSVFTVFFGLMNLGIVNELRKGEYDVVIVYGWNYFTNILAVVAAKLFGKKVMLRGDNPLSHELLKPDWKRWIKKGVLQYGIFKFVDVFLYVGEANKNFYKYYNVPDWKLIFAPHCVENERFHGEYLRLKHKRNELRKGLGLNEDGVVVIFVAILIDKKRPFDLLRAFEKVESDKKTLIFVGDGYLRKELEDYVVEKKLKNVYFVGIKNQTELPYYYTMADIFVLPSGLGETWGLVVNEAMNFELPIIVSDLVGCREDLVKHGENGFVFKTDDLDELAGYMKMLMESEGTRRTFGKKSLEIVRGYSYDRVIAAIEGSVDGVSHT